MFFIFSFITYIDIKVIENIANVSGNEVLTRDFIEKYSYSTFVQVNIEYGVKGVGSGTFSECKKLKVLKLSLSVETFAESALMRCGSLEKIIVPSQHLTLSSDMQFALYNKNKTLLIHCPAQLTSFVIPNSVERICSHCFKSNSKLLTINIPSSVTNISSSAFNEISGLKNLTYSPNSRIKIISSIAFHYSSIYEMHVPPSVEVIMSGAFMEANIHVIVFDDIEKSNLTKVEFSTFQNFKGSQIKLPPKLQSIPVNCFLNSVNLKYLNIPKNCTSIDINGFSGCSGLESITVDDGNTEFSSLNGSLFNVNYSKLFFLPPAIMNFTLPEKLEEVSVNAFHVCINLKEISLGLNKNFGTDRGVLYNSSYQEVISICGGLTTVYIRSETTKIGSSALESVSFNEVIFESDENLIEIGSSSFANCNNMTKITLPKSVQTIGDLAFARCQNIDTIYLDETKIKEIPQDCFKHSSIMKITLPKTVESIKFRSFYQCFSLKSVILPEGNILKSIEGYSFEKCNNLLMIGNLTNLQTVGDYAFQDCSKLNVDFESAVNLETLSKSCFSNCNITKAIFSSVLQSLDSEAFNNNKFLNVVEFSMDSPITLIPPGCFANCKSLSYVKLSKNIQTFDYSVFSGCLKLTTIDCSNSFHFESEFGLVYKKGKKHLFLCPPGKDSVKIVNKTIHILEHAFTGCELLTAVEFMERSNLEVVNSHTFLNCAALKDITLPESVNLIGSDAFRGCKSLKKLPFGLVCSVSSLPANCFQNSGIEEAVIPVFIKSVGDGCFNNCWNLRMAKLHSNVSCVGSRAFADCKSFRYIMICGTEVECGSECVPATARVYVSHRFIGNSFGSIPVERFLDPDCVFITQSRIDGTTPTTLLISTVVSVPEGK